MSLSLQIEAILRRVIRLTQGDPQAKLLIFSSWSDVLELVAHALQANELPFAYAHGRKGFDAAIACFKGNIQTMSPAKARGKRMAAASGRTRQTQILLLLTKQGSNGLNLTGESLAAIWGACYAESLLPLIKQGCSSVNWTGESNRARRAVPCSSSFELTGELMALGTWRQQTAGTEPAATGQAGQ